MIERIDSHDRHTFSTCYGANPIESKWAIPCVVVKTADTVNTVRSYGLTCNWYYGRDSVIGNLNTAYSGILPGGIVKFYNPRGVPPHIDEQNAVNGWSMELRGYFKAPYSGNYRFWSVGEGRMNRLLITGDNGPQSLGKNLKFENANFDNNNGLARAFTAGEWYEIRAWYSFGGEIGDPGALAILYRYIDNDTSMPDPLVLSAGVTAPYNDGNAPASNTMPISIHTVSAVSNVSLSMQENGADVFKFTVPFVATPSSYDWNGYYKSGDSYVSKEDGIELKKYRMITFDMGYCTTADPKVFQTVQKFAGQIRDFDIKYSKEGTDELEVTCYSYAQFLKDSFVLESPDKMDYICSGYVDEVIGHVNGRTKPRAYDGWEVYKVFNNLMLNAYIDPTLMYQKEKRNGKDDQYIEGNYYIDYIGRTDSLYLETQEHYGNPDNLETGSFSVDDEYAFSIDTGEFIYDAINKILDPYGFVWGINRFGYPYMKAIDTPNLVVHATSYVAAETTLNWGANWSADKDFDCVKASYIKCNIDLDLASASLVQFQRAELIVKTGASLNAAPAYLIYDTSGTLVKSDSYGSGLNWSYTSSWAYYKGVDPETGENPCVKLLASGLPYDTYSIYIGNYDNPNYMNIDAIFLYDRDYHEPVFTFRTSDTVTNGHVVTLDINDTTKDLRNDVIVLGKRTGTKTGVGFTNNWTGEINPKNPTYTFRQSRAIDLNSIYSTSASNFVGRPIQTVIIDPSITNEEHADYVSYSFIQRYRDSGKEIKFKTIGNPLIELNDCVKVIDEYKDGITTSKKLWVTNIQDDFDGDVYLTEFTATDLVPQKSYFDKPEPDLELFDNNPFWNVRIYNGGAITTLENQMNVASATAWVADSLEYIPKKGYIMLGSPQGVNEIIKYSTVSSTGGVWYVSGVLRSCQRTSAKTWAAATSAICYYDPYIADSMAIVPRITFDLVKSGYLSVKMFAVDNDIRDEDGNINGNYQSLLGVPMQLTTLTKSVNNDAEDDIDNWPHNGYQYTKWGKNRYFTWNGNDDISVWNYYVNISNKNYTTHEDEDYGKIEGGIYTIEEAKKGYTKIYPKLELDRRSEESIYQYPLSDQEDDIVYGYIRRGIVSTVTFKIDYSSVFASYDLATDISRLVRVFRQDDLPEPKLIDNSGSDTPPFKYGYMVYICTHTAGRGNRVNYEIIDETAQREYTDGDTDFYKRFCALKLVAHIQRITGSSRSGPDYGFYFKLDNNERILEEDDEYLRLFYKPDDDTGLLGRFNPKLYPSNFSYMNPELYNSTFNYYNGLYWNVIYFSGQIKDKSGRICLQKKLWGGDDHHRFKSDADFLKNYGLFEDPVGITLFREGALRGNFIGWYDKNLALKIKPGHFEMAWYYNIQFNGSIMPDAEINALGGAWLYMGRRTVFDIEDSEYSWYRGSLVLYMPNV